MPSIAESGKLLKLDEICRVFGGNTWCLSYVNAEGLLTVPIAVNVNRASCTSNVFY